jgi:hypothetical protein
MVRCVDMYALVIFYAEAMQLTLQSFDPETCVIQNETFIIQKFWFGGIDVVFTLRGSGGNGTYANIVDSKGEIEKNTNFETLDKFKEMIPVLFKHCLRSKGDFVFKFPVGPTLGQMKETVELFLAKCTSKKIDFDDTFISFSVESPLYTDENATSIRIKGTSTDELASWTQYVGSVEKRRTPFVSLADFENSISTLLGVSSKHVDDSQPLTSINSKLETIIGMLKKIDGRIVQ